MNEKRKEKPRDRKHYEESNKVPNFVNKRKPHNVHSSRNLRGYSSAFKNAPVTGRQYKLHVDFISEFP